MEVRYEDLKKDVPFELQIYTRNHVVETSTRKGPFSDLAVKVLKGHTRAIRCLYHVKDINRGYRL